MPPRFAYWTIILDGAPTAFRARDRAELATVYRQFANRHPKVEIKWFAGGRLWESPEEARRAARPPREPRGPDWRPGGEHQDPRARFRKRGPKRQDGRRAAPKPQHPIADSAEAHGESPREDRPPHRNKRTTGQDRRSRHPQSRQRPAGARPQRHERPWRPKNERDRARTGQHGPRERERREANGAGGRGESKPPETEPPAPPEPPGPERPPKPGQEPRPETPQPERIEILPETPERAK